MSGQWFPEGAALPDDLSASDLVEARAATRWSPAGTYVYRGYFHCLSDGDRVRYNGHSWGGGTQCVRCGLRKAVRPTTRLQQIAVLQAENAALRAQLEARAIEVA